LLFITNITGYTSDKYSWKSYPVQRDSRATDSTPAGGERPPKKETKYQEHTKGWQLERVASSFLYQKGLYDLYVSFHPST